MATHFGLFGGTLLSLGSENQQRLIDSIDNGTISGCFALAEVGYGWVEPLVNGCVFRAGLQLPPQEQRRVYEDHRHV
jgi:hypothetical protein